MKRKDNINEYKINKFISLKLENNKTTIYINGKKFIHCKYLFFVNTKETLNNNFKSVDDAGEKFEAEMQDRYFLQNLDLTSGEIFWGHCSNLQAWAENSYDSRILHSNLAFPLLKKLSELGDRKARRVFKEEIVRRFIEGSNYTRKFLCEEHYIEELNEEELGMIVNPLSVSILKKIEKEMNKKLELVIDNKIHCNDAYRIEKCEIVGLNITGDFKFSKIPPLVNQLGNLKTLECSLFKINVPPMWINDLTNLEVLNLTQNNIKIFNRLELPKLKQFILSHNELKEIDFSESKLPNIEFIRLSNNKIEQIEGLGSLKSLKNIGLFNNKLKDIPKQLLELPKLNKILVGKQNSVDLDSNEIIKKLKEKGVEVY